MVYRRLVSWGIALFEYLLQVLANRLGHQVMSVAQLKILQKSSPQCLYSLLPVFMKEKLNWNFLWAGLCMVGAVYFMFRK